MNKKFKTEASKLFKHEGMEDKGRGWERYRSPELVVQLGPYPAGTKFAKAMVAYVDNDLRFEPLDGSNETGFSFDEKSNSFVFKY